MSVPSALSCFHSFSHTRPLTPSLSSLPCVSVCLCWLLFIRSIWWLMRQHVVTAKPHRTGDWRLAPSLQSYVFVGSFLYLTLACFWMESVRGPVCGSSSFDSCIYLTTSGCESSMSAAPSHVVDCRLFRYRPERVGTTHKSRRAKYTCGFKS